MNKNVVFSIFLRILDIVFIQKYLRCIEGEKIEIQSVMTSVVLHNEIHFLVKDMFNDKLANKTTITLQ